MSAPRVPKAQQKKYSAVRLLTDTFCEAHLTDEYADLARQITAALCRKRPSPLNQGSEAGWAAGIIHALGVLNFLFDRSQSPHLTPRLLYEAFGVSQSTGSSKSRAVRDSLKMMSLDPKWTLPSRMADNPMVWMVMVNGLVVDIRDMPREIQEAAYEQGIIPYIPDQDGRSGA
jgi:hypothetical protein